MEMYKKAAQLDLRFESKKGLLTVSQLFSLSLNEIASIIKLVNAQLESQTETSSKLSFLDETVKVDEVNQLRFEILKDIYIDKKKEKDEAAHKLEVKEHNQKILELIEARKNRELQELSIEELEKRLIS